MTPIIAIIVVTLTLAAWCRWRDRRTAWKARRTELVGLAVASRCTTMDELPEDFMVMLRAALHTPAEDIAS